MIGDLIVGFAWRFAWALRPVFGRYADYHFMCHNRHGFVGTHAGDRDGRCVTCERQVRRA